MKFRSDFEKYGFDETEIIPFLAKHGISIGDTTVTAKPATDESFPQWKRLMSLLPKLTDTEAASAFAGIDLDAAGWLSDDEEAELSRWQSIIRRAILAKELEAVVSDFNHDGTTKEWSINHADLVVWSETKGISYPLPSRILLPVTDAGLRDALMNCDRERAMWKAKADALGAVSDQRTNLQAEISKLHFELRAKTEEFAALATELGALKIDVLAGKAKTTALKIIGGLAIGIYRMDIHTGRLERIGEMVADLEKSGVQITEKTLREWIKEAANVIESLKMRR